MRVLYLQIAGVVSGRDINVSALGSFILSGKVNSSGMGYAAGMGPGAGDSSDWVGGGGSYAGIIIICKFYIKHINIHIYRVIIY